MPILRDISSMWASSFSLVMLMILFESRYSRKKTFALTAALMLPLLAVNFVLLFLLGPQTMSTLLLLTCTLPSLVFFWILSKHRDGRFFFTFCLADTLMLEIMHVTTVLDHFLGDTYIFMFAARLILCPVLAFVVDKWIRSIYLDVQNKVKKGWYIFTVIALLFYVVLSISISTPTLITQRPEQLPAFALLLILMPAIYIYIFYTLRLQQQAYETEEEENILRLQVANLTERMEALAAADEKFCVERHDFRHKLRIIAGLAKKQQYAELCAMLEEYGETLDRLTVKRYCRNAVLDAVLASYLQKAESRQIRVDVSIAEPDELPAADAQIATMFANAIENAIQACEKLPPEERLLSVKVLEKPRFMFQISNSFNGEVTLDKNGIPVSFEDGHGLGIRSIVTFCEKNGAFYEFKAEEKLFTLRISF